jgi:hypothetical protein
MWHIRLIRSVGFVLCVLILSALLPRQLLAHRPIFTNDKATSANTAIQIKTPEVSQVVYREITGASSQVWLSFETPANFKLFVQIGVPVIDRLKDFRPAMAIVGPGLSDKANPFKLPKDTGAKILLTKGVKKPQFFHEPFTNTDSRILRSETVILPKAGRYYLVGYSPDRRAGKLWLSVGKKESFSSEDFKDLSTWTKKIQTFHEVKGR